MTSIPVEKLFSIIHEDGELLVVSKPAGLVCHPTKTDEYSSLISRVRLYLGKDRPAHLVNRLDRETSGVTLVAKCDDAAREIRRLWENRLVEKEYVAIVHGHVCAESGLIDAPLGKDEASRVAVKDCVRSDGLPSLTEFFVEKRFSRAEGDFTLLRVRLLTGRKHQIRIHLAHIGHPIVGDYYHRFSQHILGASGRKSQMRTVSRTDEACALTPHCFVKAVCRSPEMPPQRSISLDLPASQKIFPYPDFQILSNGRKLFELSFC